METPPTIFLQQHATRQAETALTAIEIAFWRGVLLGIEGGDQRTVSPSGGYNMPGASPNWPAKVTPLQADNLLTQLRKQLHHGSELHSARRTTVAIRSDGNGGSA